MILELEISNIFSPGFGHYYLRLKILAQFLFFHLFDVLFRGKNLVIEYSWLWSSVQILIQKTRGTRNYQYRVWSWVFKYLFKKHKELETISIGFDSECSNTYSKNTRNWKLSVYGWMVGEVERMSGVERMRRISCYWCSPIFN